MFTELRHKKDILMTEKNIVKYEYWAITIMFCNEHLWKLKNINKNDKIVVKKKSAINMCLLYVVSHWTPCMSIFLLYVVTQWTPCRSISLPLSLFLNSIVSIALYHFFCFYRSLTISFLHLTGDGSFKRKMYKEFC